MPTKCADKLSSELGWEIERMLGIFYDDLREPDPKCTRFNNLLPPAGRCYFKKHRELLKMFITTLITLAPKVLETDTFQCSSLAESLLIGWLVQELRTSRELSEDELSEDEYQDRADDLDDFLGQATGDCFHTILYEPEYDPATLAKMKLDMVLKVEYWFMPYTDPRSINPLTWPASQNFDLAKWSDYQYEIGLPKRKPC